MNKSTGAGLFNINKKYCVCQEVAVYILLPTAGNGKPDKQ